MKNELTGRAGNDKRASVLQSSREWDFDLAWRGNWLSKSRFRVCGRRLGNNPAGRRSEFGLIVPARRGFQKLTTTENNLTSRDFTGRDHPARRPEVSSPASHEAHAHECRALEASGRGRGTTVDAYGPSQFSASQPLTTEPRPTTKRSRTSASYCNLSAAFPTYMRRAERWPGFNFR